MDAEPCSVCHEPMTPLGVAVLRMDGGRIVREQRWTCTSSECAAARAAGRRVELAHTA